MHRAGVLRRHTFFCRYTPPIAVPLPVSIDGPGPGAADADRTEGRPATLALPGAIDADWDWWPSFEEVRDRIINQPVWLEAVGATYADHLAAFASVLQGVRLIAMDSPQRRR